MRTVTVEEHFSTPLFLSGLGKQFGERLRGSGPRGARIYDQLAEVGSKRVAEMDAAGIDVQLLSLNSPGVEQGDVPDQLTLSRESNDFLAEAIKQHPKRFDDEDHGHGPAPGPAVTLLRPVVSQRGGDGKRTQAAGDQTEADVRLHDE